MSVLEYAQDVNKTVEEIFKLCDKLEIKVKNEDDMLEQDDIILLDNEIQDQEDYVVEDTEEDDDLFEKVEDLALNTKLGAEKQKTKNRQKKEQKTNKENKKMRYSTGNL